MTDFPPLPDDVHPDLAAAQAAAAPPPVVATVVALEPPSASAMVSGGSMLLGVTPGGQTSEFKVMVSLVSFLQLISAVVLALAGTGAFHFPDWVTAGVPAINAAVSGWLASNYANNRTAVKTAAIAGPNV